MTVKNKLQESNLSEQEIGAQLEMPFDTLEIVARTRDGLRRLLSYALTTGHLKGLQKAAENYNAIFRGEEVTA